MIIYVSQYREKNPNKSQNSVMQHISQPGGAYINQPEGGIDNSDKHRLIMKTDIQSLMAAQPIQFKIRIMKPEPLGFIWFSDLSRLESPYK